MTHDYYIYDRIEIPRIHITYHQSKTIIQKIQLNCHSEKVITETKLYQLKDKNFPSNVNIPIHGEFHCISSFIRQFKSFKRFFKYVVRIF